MDKIIKFLVIVILILGIAWLLVNFKSLSTVGYHGGNIIDYFKNVFHSGGY